MSANMKTEGVDLIIKTAAGDEVMPWWQWTTLYFEFVLQFEAGDVVCSDIEHRFTVKAGSSYAPGQVEIAVRCDDATEWTPLDTVAWSPDSIIDTRFLPKAYAEQVRHALFIDIAKTEAEMTEAYTTACLAVVDSGSDSPYHATAKQRDEIAKALRQLRVQFGAATIERRITAALRFEGSSMPVNEILAAVLDQPGAVPQMANAIVAELEKADGSDREGYLVFSGSGDHPRYDLATVPFSEAQRQAEKKVNDNAKRAAREAIEMAAARERTASRKAQEAADAVEGKPAPAPGLPVAWMKNWDGYHTAKCGTAPLVAVGDITRSTSGSGAWTVSVGSKMPVVTEDEEAARYELEQRLRAEVAKLTAAAAAPAPAPKPAVQIEATEPASIPSVHAS